MPLPVPLDRLIEILRGHSLDLQHQIGSCPMQLSLPTDGKGVRVRVSVPQGCRLQLPDNVTFVLGSETFLIPLEIDEEYQRYLPHSSDHSVLPRP